MENHLKYTVRSREIVDLMAAMRNESLTLSPYFQRNLVWREAHKKDFIDTILNGYPFPQIFLARGAIDVDKMTSAQAVVDGQQRLNTIREFINGELEVEGRKFADLEKEEKESFLKYEVAVIDFDLDVADPKIKEVFHRLNRTYYSLSAIEKLASEYSASEFMLVGRVLAGEILPEPIEIPELFDDMADAEHAALGNIFSRDPGISDATWQWMVDHAGGTYATLIKDRPVFTTFEFDRKVPLMFSLNLMCTYLAGYYERNNLVRRYLDEKAEQFNEKQEVLERLDMASHFVSQLALPDNSMWWNKANFFTLIVELARNPALVEKPVDSVGIALAQFSEQVPEQYSLDAREAVSRKPQRERRGQVVRDLIEAVPTP